MIVSTEVGGSASSSPEATGTTRKHRRLPSRPSTEAIERLSARLAGLAGRGAARGAAPRRRGRGTSALAAMLYIAAFHSFCSVSKVVRETEPCLKFAASASPAPAACHSHMTLQWQKVKSLLYRALQVSARPPFSMSSPVGRPVAFARVPLSSTVTRLRSRRLPDSPRTASRWTFTTSSPPSRRHWISPLSFAWEPRCPRRSVGASSRRRSTSWSSGPSPGE